MSSGKKYLVTFFVLLIFIVIFYVSKNTVEFVYVNPDVNTEALPFISSVIKKIDEGVRNSVLNCNLNRRNMKILYQNAYGSGFIKHNPIPNDLDYSVGIHLGKYVYDEKNAAEIAQDIDDKMSSFQINFYNYISNNKTRDFLSELDVLGSIIHFDKKRATNIGYIERSLLEIFKNEEYIVYLEKSFPDRPEVVLEYPFVLKSGEILIEDYAPIRIFTKGVKYNKNQRDFLREITIVVDFYVDIKNTKTKKTKTVEIVAESFIGQRLQLSRRFFPPIVFIGENSANYLKNLDYLKDDGKYLEYRLFSFKRHLQEFSALSVFKDRPVKMLKRILQCTEIISPALDEKTKDEIYKTIYQNLSNPEIIVLNDYSTALGNLIHITQTPKLYLKASGLGVIQKLVESMREDLNKLKSVDSKDVRDLFEFQNYIEQSISAIQNRDDLSFFAQNLLLKMEKYNNNILSLFNKNMTDLKQILSYINIFNKVYEDAGFHKIELYWLDKNTLGIIKDDFTKNIPSDELSDFALQNGLVNINYKLISRTQVPKISIGYINWARYNPTPAEEQNRQKLKEQLLKDKSNFKVKRKFIVN